MAEPPRESIGEEYILEKIRLGIPLIDQLLPEGVFRRSLMVMAGDSGVGKSFIAGLMAWSFASRGEPVFYIALDDDPLTVASSLQAKGYDVWRLIREKRIVFVDGYGARYGVEPEPFVEESLRDIDPWTILNTVNRLVDSRKLRCRGLLVVDSLNPLLQKYEVSNVFDFVNAIRASTVKKKGVFTVMTIHTASQFYTEVAASLEYMVDVLVWMQHMEAAIEQGYPVKELLVKKARGVAATASWTPYMITNEGLVGVKLKTRRAKS